jgi:DNA-binding PadR family transcriptional regulator
MPRALPVRPSPYRLLRLYALAAMERDGPLYGYGLAARVADRTAGAWRPGPGAVYPALGRLVTRGWARADRVGRRRVYRITAQGRRFLARVRLGLEERRRLEPDVGPLWAEISGRPEFGEFVLDRFERQLDRLVEFLASPTLSPARARAHRQRALRALKAAERRLGRPGGLAPARRRAA